MEKVFGHGRKANFVRRQKFPHGIRRTFSIASQGNETNAGESVKIVADIDVGFGNFLYIRGDGCGLSWDKGVMMTPVDDRHWQWKCGCDSVNGCFEFKVLINDEIWSVGENYVAIGFNGLSNEISPEF
ncbi:MAG: hypothetical protein LBB18_02770 [Puniceicoccales bacterium]|jgi:hypothetical protein|nr:hypothetical protein [Puniceicoccales bacterium]